MKSYLKILSGITAIGLMASCSDDKAAFEENLNGTGQESTFTLSIVESETVELNSRGGRDIAISTFACLDINASRKVSGRHTGLQTTRVDEGVYEVTTNIARDTRWVHFFANVPDSYVDSATDPAAIFISDIDENHPVLWGNAELKNVLMKGTQIPMIRQTAKVTVNSSASGFTLSQFGVFGTAGKGSVAPAGWSLSPTEPTNAPGETFTRNTGMKGASEAAYVFETPKDEQISGTGTFRTRARIILKGTYQGYEGYYVAAFRTRTGTGPSENPAAYSYAPIHILRNHHYILSISEVRAKGWPTLEEAMKAEPDNRLTVTVTDRTDNVNNITATRDYMLGVCDAVSIESTADKAEITVVTSYPGTPRLSFSADRTWIHASNIQTGSPVTVNDITAGTNPTGYRYKITVPVDRNNASSASRSGLLTVRSGDLTRSVTITQAGYDYRRAADRKVTFRAGSTTITTDYFSWMDNTCKGLRPEDNRNVERNQGLHFPAVPAYQATYLIPRLSGDKSATIESGNFSVVQNGSDWQVTANSPTSVSISTGSLKIVNANNVEIIYPLYRTGYFHELTAATEPYQRENGALSGWYYYEVVRLPNGSYILDRNIGATTNAPYISTYAGFSGNTGARGAYFKIATEKSNRTDNPLTIIDKLNISKFKIPTDTEISGWGIKTTNVSGTSGETSVVATIATTGSRVAGNCVYLPHGGYYEATSHKYETHANIWTRTLLAGNQGFDPERSPEFGYWFLYLDVYGRKTTMSQIRFFNGSGGQAPTDASVFKYMPLRLVWDK